MYLNVEISENEYLDKRRKIKAINQFLTLLIKNDTAYISKGIVKLKDTFYFGKYDESKEMYQLIKLKHNSDENEYYKFKLIAKKLIKEGDKIKTIKFVSKKELIKKDDESESIIDKMYWKVRLHVIKTKLASTSNLQYKFNISYENAYEMLNMLEKEGIVVRNEQNRRIVK